MAEIWEKSFWTPLRNHPNHPSLLNRPWTVEYYTIHVIHPYTWYYFSRMHWQNLFLFRLLTKQSGIGLIANLEVIFERLFYSCPKISKKFKLNWYWILYLFFLQAREVTTYTKGRILFSVFSSVGIFWTLKYQNRLKHLSNYTIMTSAITPDLASNLEQRKNRFSCVSFKIIWMVIQ